MVTEFNPKGGLSNTRPERTDRPGLRVLVDWVSCTFHMDADFDQIKQVLGIPDLEMEYFDWGRNTFKEHIRFSNIIIQRKDETNYQLSLSGQGCREFENLSKYNWLELIAILKEFAYCKFTRLDLAIDDFQEHFNVARIRQYLQKKLVITRLEDYDDRKKHKIKTGQPIMDSIYLGSINSRLSINFYDKKLEQDNKDKESDGSWDSWTRTELRLKKEYADQTADMILLYNMDLGKVAFGILSKNIRFIKRSGKDKNLRRRDESTWWLNFIGKVEKLKFSLESPDRTIEKAKKWTSHSVAPSLAAIKESDPDNFETWLGNEIELAKERLTSKHEMMINQAKELKILEATKLIKKAGSDKNKSIHQEIYLRNQKNEFEYRQRKNPMQDAPDSNSHL